MKQPLILSLTIVVIVLVLSYQVYQNGIKQGYKNGFEDGAMNQVTYIQAFPNDGYMSLWFRQYLEDKNLGKLSPLGIKIAYANCEAITDINIHDTTGLQARIDSAKKVHYEQWLADTEKWKDSIDNIYK